MTYVDYNNATTAMGEISKGETARSGYNNISGGYVGFARTDWGSNWITYIQVDASGINGTITGATLTADISGSTDSKRTTTYLTGLFERTYISDVIERNNLKGDKDVLEDLLNILASLVGSLTNTTRLENTFKSERGVRISHNTISAYIDTFIDAFIIKKVARYDIKGRKYIGAQQQPLKLTVSKAEQSRNM